MGIALDRVVHQDRLGMLQGCTCISCHKLIEPSGALQAPCTHILCSSCISSSVADSMLHCPEDNKPVKGEKLQPFKDANPMMYDMLNNRVDVKCVRFNEGCPWQGNLLDVAKHETTCTGITHCKCCDDNRKRWAELQEQARASAAAAIAASSLRQQLDLAHMDNEQLQKKLDREDAKAAALIQKLTEQLAAEKKRCTELERKRGMQERTEEQLQQLKVRASDLDGENEKLERRVNNYRVINSTLEEEVSSLKKKLSSAPSTPRNRENGTSSISENLLDTPPRRGLAPADAASSSNGASSQDPSSRVPRNLRTAPSESLPGPTSPRLEVPARPQFEPLRAAGYGAEGIGRSNDEAFVVTEGQQRNGRRRPGHLSIPTTEACLWDLVDHMGSVTAIAVSKRHVYSASADRSIKIWTDDRCVWTYLHTPKNYFATSKDAGHTNTVLALCYGPDDVLYSASIDSTIKVWESKKCKATLKGHKGSVLALAISSKNVLFSGGSDKTIRRWEDGEWKATLGPRTLHNPEGHSEPVNALAIAPDDLLWSGDDGGNIMRWQHGVPIGEFNTIQGRGITGLVFDKDGTLWTASSSSNEVKGWKEKRCVTQLHGHVDSITALAISPDGTVWSGSRNGTVRGHRWDREAPPTCVMIYKGHNGAVTSLAVGPDGMLWSGGRDKRIKGWPLLGQGLLPSGAC